MNPRRMHSMIWAITLVAVITLPGIGASGDEPVPGTAAPPPLQVLFIGNSQTFHNKVYQLVEGISRAAGVQRPVQATRITRGGETFQRHTERRDAEAPLRVIAEGGWDFVILQEHSRVLLEQGLTSFPFASRLVRAAREAGATPIFYLTWAYHPTRTTRPASPNCTI